MNNTQFRRLVLDTPTSTRTGNGNGSATDATPQRLGATPSVLGSRMRSNIPMTPHSLSTPSSLDFARQLVERNGASSAAKKFRSISAPKGTKLRSGYQDRTQLRTSTEDDDKATRVKALEEMVKLGQMEMATFEALRDEIVGGDVKDVHLVKGLDWKLLERVRRGEDVLGGDEAKVVKANNFLGGPEDGDVGEKAIDVEEELERMEGKEVQPMAKSEKQKKGDMAQPPLVAGKKRNRNEILKELKESRLLVALKEKEAKHPSLGPRFSKVGEKREKSRIEIDERGREILITVDENGNLKRKVKRPIKVDESVVKSHGLLMPDKDSAPLGMEVNAQVVPPPANEEEDEDVDIFEGIGADYDPLGLAEGDDDEDDSDIESEEEKIEKSAKAPLSPKPINPDDLNKPLPPETKDISAMPPPSLSYQRSKPARDYFNEPTIETTLPTLPSNSLSDPAILAALKKASAINPLSSITVDPSETAKNLRHKKLLDSHDRDAEDMDLGFGSSRFGDEEEMEEGGKKVKLSVWGSKDDGEGDGEGKGKRKRGRKNADYDEGEAEEKRKRGGKKRKGDVNSAADVLKVMARRKGDGKNRSLSVRSKKDNASTITGSSEKSAPKHRFSIATLRGIQQPEMSKKLYKIIKSENHAIGAYESASRERMSIASQLSDWGESTGDDSISDVSDKLGVLLSELGEQEDVFAQNLEDYRGVLKQIRNTESSVQPSRDHKAKISDEIQKLKYKEPQSTKLVQLEQELVRAEAQNLVAEAQLTNITRQKLKEAYDLHFAATIERAEKQTMLARHGRRLLNLLDDTPVVPGDTRPAFEHAHQARQILNDAEEDLREWTPNLEPIPSAATEMGANLMPSHVATAGTSVGGQDATLMSEAGGSPVQDRIAGGSHEEAFSHANQTGTEERRDFSGSSNVAHAEPSLSYQQ